MIKFFNVKHDDKVIGEEFDSVDNAKAFAEEWFDEYSIGSPMRFEEDFVDIVTVVMCGDCGKQLEVCQEEFHVTWEI